MINVELSPEVAKIALWFEEKLTESPFSDAGVVGTIHNGRITKVRFEQTIKEFDDAMDFRITKRMT